MKHVIHFIIYNIVPFISVILAAALYAWQEFRYFYEADSNANPFSFWGRDSHLRKYYRTFGSNHAIYLTEPPKLTWWNSWYYKFFNVERREAFPLSATALVWLTDGYHFVQFWMLKLIFLAICLGIGSGFSWWVYILIWLAWAAGFNLAFKGLKIVRQRRKEDDI